MEDIVKMSLLYDFYGELLTQHQRQLYELAVFHDLSLSEIAQEANISRQAASDLLRRVDRQLMEYERKLHLAAKFRVIRDSAEQIGKLAKKGRDKNEDPDRKDLEQIDDLAQTILGEI